MRRLLYAAAILVFLAGVQLFVFPERTERYFAWTIDPPVTAAFLGASYWSSVAFEWTAAREERWANARIAVPAVSLFTILTLVVTLVHIDRFHLGGTYELATQAVTWAWIAIYAVVPVLMAALLVAQRRVVGEDPPRTVQPPAWLAAVVGLQAIFLVSFGAALLIAPNTSGQIWPWSLTPLTARAIGAWLLSLGVAAVHAIGERDPRRLKPAAIAYVVFAVLQAVTLARYPHWSGVRSVLYVAFLASAFIVGTTTLVLAARADGSRATAR